MKVVEISEDNLKEFASYLGPDVADDMKRSFYRGYGAVDEDGAVKGALVYELLGADNDDEEIRSALRFLKAEDAAVFDSIHQLYKQEGIGIDEISESFYQFEEEEPAASCEKQGFSKDQKEGDIIRLTLGDALKFDFVNKLKKIPDYIVSLETLSMMQFRSAIRNCIFNKQKGLMEDLGYLTMGWFDIELSACTIMDGEVKGLFLVRVTPSGIITPMLLFGQGADFKKHLAYMLAYSVKKAGIKYSPETEIRINCARKPTEALVKNLIPMAKGNLTFFGTRKEG